jgi:hypothetical protein
VDVPAAAVQSLARRTDRDPDEFLAEWRDKTPADCERFWRTLTPDRDDDLLHIMANLARSQASPSAVSLSVNDLGETTVPKIVRAVPSVTWPSVLFVSGSTNDLSSVGNEAAKWAMQAPVVPIAIAVLTGVWDEYLANSRDSRTKALLREGEVAIPAIDAATVERKLSEAGAAACTVAAVATNGADVALVESAVAAIRATAAPPTNEPEDDRARSAAERFLFEFLESLPETAGRFELNASLDFPFGSRGAEVDLLCRSQQIAIEVDGYYHFLTSNSYRRDRTKDWELQRRGFVVLRFLAEDVIPQLEMIRDRILEAVTVTPLGGTDP